MDTAKRRILFLVTSADWGGVQSFLHNIAVTAKERGFEVCIAAGESGELEERCRDSHIPFHRLHRLKRNISPIHDLAAIYEIRSLIKSFKPDVIHLNSSKAGIIGSVAANLERVPFVIYRIGGWVFEEKISSLKRSMYRWLEKTTARNKDVIVTVHPGDEALAEKIGIRPRGRLVTIPNGLDLDRFDRNLKTKDEARRILGIEPDAFVVGTVANYYPAKNLPWLLKQIGRHEVLSAAGAECKNAGDAEGGLPSRGTNVSTAGYRSGRTRHMNGNQFVIIGDGPQREEIDTLHATLRLDKTVLLAGRRADASTLLSAFDIFILPSTKEGMPWSLLEAMASRLPCIATDVGACRWMLEPDAGIIIPADDAAALFNAIQKLRNDPELRASLGANARHTVETRFTWQSTAQQTLSLFNTPLS